MKLKDTQGAGKKHLLLDTTFTLRLISNGQLVPGEGQRLLSVFLSLVREVDPALAAELHDSKRIKPFSVSFLFGEIPSGLSKGSEKNSISDTGKEFFFRVTTFDQRLSEVWKGGVLPCVEGKTIRIGSELFVVSDYTFEEETIVDIYRRHIIDNMDPGTVIVLRFHTPTAFRSGRANFLFPEPRFVWLSLNRAWSNVAPVDLGRDLHLWAEKEIRVSKYDLKTNILHFDRYRQIGFTGHCEYRVHTDEVNRLKSYHLLADFSRYSGVGIKTTMGMGQTTRLQ